MPLERFKHQLEIWEETRDKENFALLWEMRVGKNLPILDTISYQYNNDKIDTCVIIAPSGVHSNWTRKVIPPERPGHDRILEWNAGKSGQVGFQRIAKQYATEPGRLLWVSVNAEALTTDNWQEFEALVLKRKPARIIDESDILKSSRAKRTKWCIKQTDKYILKRILTGTAAPQSPFDLWSQYACLSKSIIGIDAYIPFTQRYGIFKRVRFGGPSFDQLERYRDLDHLKARYMPHSSRLLQRDVYDNLPQLTVIERSFEMSAVQQKAYNSMRDDMLLQIREGLVLTASMAMVVCLRLQQISRGFIQQGEEVYDLGGPKPAIESLLQALQQIDGKVIIWCNFKEDVTAVIAALKEAGRKPVRYDGNVSKDERYANKEAFLTDDSITDFVGTPASGGVGTDISVAETTIFYSHSYKLRERLQAIARNQGPNQKAQKLLLVSMVAEGTGDSKIIERLEQKRKMMSQLMGDIEKYEDPIDQESHMELLKQFLEA